MRCAEEDFEGTFSAIQSIRVRNMRSAERGTERQNEKIMGTSSQPPVCNRINKLHTGIRRAAP